MKSFLLGFFSRGSLYFLKVDLHFLFLRLSNAVSSRSPRRIKPDARFLNIGCGSVGIDSADWFNVDGWWAKGVDYACDLRRRLPLSDNRFDGVYSEHFFEHLHPADARRFLGDCRRILRPNGIIRLSVPDGELFLKNYFEDRAWMLGQIESREWLQDLDECLRTPMGIVNEVFRQHYEHQFCYDFETLSATLAEAGFTNVSRVGFGSGASEPLQIDRKTRRAESLYVEGRKPA